MIADRLRVFGDPVRLHILQRLQRGEATVQDLADALDTTHQNLSKHLAVFYGHGMVTRRRDGTRVYYALSDYTGWWIVEKVGASLLAHLEEQRQAFEPAGDD